MLMGLAIFVIGVWVVIVVLSRKGMPLAGAIALAIVIQIAARLVVFIALIALGVALRLMGVSSEFLGLAAFIVSPFFGAVLGILIANALPSSQEAARMQFENQPHRISCTDCGRENAITTKICPQCGRRRAPDEIVEFDGFGKPIWKKVSGKTT